MTMYVPTSLADVVDDSTAASPAAQEKCPPEPQSKPQLRPGVLAIQARNPSLQPNTPWQGRWELMTQHHVCPT